MADAATSAEIVVLIFVMLKIFIPNEVGVPAAFHANERPSVGTILRHDVDCSSAARANVCHRFPFTTGVTKNFFSIRFLARSFSFSLIMP